MRIALPLSALLRAVAAVWAAACLLTATALAAPHDFVEVTEVVPGIVVDLKYATPNNFLRRQVYAEARCFVRRSTAEKLAKVQAELKIRKLGLKIWDGYRPLSVQREMWKLVPDARYVADPAQGSRHNRGAAVDVTLVDEKGAELEMPTAFDDFSEKAHSSYQGASVEATKNRSLLLAVMTKHGFTNLPTEWWHFDDASWRSFPISEELPKDEPSGAGREPTLQGVVRPSAGRPAKSQKSLEERVRELEARVEALEKERAQSR